MLLFSRCLLTQGFCILIIHSIPFFRRYVGVRFVCNSSCFFISLTLLGVEPIYFFVVLFMQPFRWFFLACIVNWRYLRRLTCFYASSWSWALVYANLITYLGFNVRMNDPGSFNVIMQCTRGDQSDYILHTSRVKHRNFLLLFPLSIISLLKMIASSFAEAATRRKGN